jgi:hypothetical protein
MQNEGSPHLGIKGPRSNSVSTSIAFSYLISLSYLLLEPLQQSLSGLDIPAHHLGILHKTLDVLSDMSPFLGLEGSNPGDTMVQMA